MIPLARTEQISIDRTRSKQKKPWFKRTTADFAVGIIQTEQVSKRETMLLITEFVERPPRVNPVRAVRHSGIDERKTYGQLLRIRAELGILNWRPVMRISIQLPKRLIRILRHVFIYVIGDKPHRDIVRNTKISHAMTLGYMLTGKFLRNNVNEFTIELKVRNIPHLKTRKNISGGFIR